MRVLAIVRSLSRGSLSGSSATTVSESFRPSRSQAGRDALVTIFRKICCSTAVRPDIALPLKSFEDASSTAMVAETRLMQALHNSRPSTNFVGLLRIAQPCINRSVSAGPYRPISLRAYQAFLGEEGLNDLHRSHAHRASELIHFYQSSLSHCSIVRDIESNEARRPDTTTLLASQKTPET